MFVGRMGFCIVFDFGIFVGLFMFWILFFILDVIFDIWIMFVGWFYVGKKMGCCRL